MKRRKHSKHLVLSSPIAIWAGPLSTAGLMIMALGLMMFSAARPGDVSAVRMGVSDFAAPFIATITKPVQGAALFVRNVSGLSELQATNAALLSENQRLRDWYQSALLLDAENKSLRGLLNVKAASAQSYITARVLADSGNAYVKSLLVEAGGQDRVRKNMAVISGEGLVGRVIEVGKGVSRILLVSDINSRIPVLVEDTSQHAVMAGGNNGQPHLMHLPIDSRVQIGARIVTSGYGGVFPPGLPVGRITAVKEGQAQVSLFADINKTVFVRIIDQPQDSNLQSAIP